VSRPRGSFGGVGRWHANFGDEHLGLVLVGDPLGRSATGCHGWPPWATLCPKLCPAAAARSKPCTTRPFGAGGIACVDDCQGWGRGFESRRPLQKVAGQGVATVRTVPVSGHNPRTPGTNVGGTGWYRSAWPVKSWVSSRPLCQPLSSRRVKGEDAGLAGAPSSRLAAIAAPTASEEDSMRPPNSALQLSSPSRRAPLSCSHTRSTFSSAPVSRRRRPDRASKPCAPATEPKRIWRPPIAPDRDDLLYAGTNGLGG
jgi:hypothetical protein